MTRLRVVKADITTLAVDVIVNAANHSLLGGGGVDGAIHRAAGAALLDACRKLNGCATGEAKITRGYLLPARYVIHTVGPVWHGGTQGEARLLGACYLHSLELARQHELRTIAFPSISTGVYGYPIVEAATVAVEATRRSIRQGPDFEEVIFCCYSDGHLQVYEALLNPPSA